MFTTTTQKHIVSLIFALFLVGSVKAESADAELEYNRAEYIRKTQDIAAWLAQQSYWESRILVIKGMPRVSVAELIAAYTPALQSRSLSTIGWYRLAESCSRAQDNYARAYLRAIVANEKSLQDESYDKSLAQWCQSERILQRYQDLDSDNAWAYLLQLDGSKDQRYSKTNLKLLQQAADARLMQSYFGQGLDKYLADLQEYYRIYPGLINEEKQAYASMGWELDIEDLIISRAWFVMIASIPDYLLLSDICKPDEMPSGNKSISINKACLQIAAKMKADGQTVLSKQIANSIIIGLSEPGSNQQLEEERQRLVAGQVNLCLFTWSPKYLGNPKPEYSMRIITRALPLYATHSEIQAYAIAADAFYQEKYPGLQRKPSDCLLLEELDYAAVLKLKQETTANFRK